MYKSVKLSASILLYGFFLLGLSACGDNAGSQADASTSGKSNVIVELTNAETHPVGYFKYGNEASPEEIAGWDIDIRPDGQGLPEGSGTVEDGEMLYEAKCASCHGSFGEGAQGYPVLAGGEGSLTEARPEKTVGSYWPYASTLWDYIHRAMPFQAPESLEDDEVYALTAYVLYLNELVEDDFELNKQSFSSIVMPNQASFYRDDRPDVQAVRCMQNCKSEPVTITSEPANSTLFTEDAESGAADTVAAENTLGKDTYQAACALCHASGVAGAPVTGDAGQWQERVAKGQDVLVHNVINGIGAMPAKGGQTQLSDDAIMAAVSFMLSDLN